MMQIRVPLKELNSRIERFRKQMDERCPGWEITAIFSKINVYYFTGTMQEGVLFIPRSEEAVFWVRRSYVAIKKMYQGITSFNIKTVTSLGTI